MTDKKATGQEYEALISPFYNKMQNSIPKHKEIFEKFKLRVNKLITQGYIYELQKETTEKMENIQELEAFKQELNNLKLKISKTNHHIIDSKFEHHRVSINELLEGYSEHMDIVNDILSSRRLKDEDTEDENVPSERFPKTISAFEKYKDQFLKYEALHEYVDDDFLYDVMKEVVDEKVIESKQSGGSSISGYEIETSNMLSSLNLKSGASAPPADSADDEM